MNANVASCLQVWVDKLFANKFNILYHTLNNVGVASRGQNIIAGFKKWCLVQISEEQIFSQVVIKLFCFKHWSSLGAHLLNLCSTSLCFIDANSHCATKHRFKPKDFYFICSKMPKMSSWLWGILYVQHARLHFVYIESEEYIFLYMYIYFCWSSSPVFSQYIFGVIWLKPCFSYLIYFTKFNILIWNKPVCPDVTILLHIPIQFMFSVSGTNVLNYHQRRYAVDGFNLSVCLHFAV